VGYGVEVMVEIPLQDVTFIGFVSKPIPMEITLQTLYREVGAFAFYAGGVVEYKFPGQGFD
jgi:hypothetical protein